MTIPARRGRRAVLLTIPTVLVLGVAGGAAGYFSVVGAGAGSGASTTTAPVVLSPGTAAADLYPGASAPVTLTLHNPGTVTARVPSLALATGLGTGGFDVDAGHAGCATGVLSYTTQSNGGSGWTIPAGATVPVTLPGSVSMGLAAADACQGAVVTVYLTAGP